MRSGGVTAWSGSSSTAAGRTWGSTRRERPRTDGFHASAARHLLLETEATAHSLLHLVKAVIPVPEEVVGLDGAPDGVLPLLAAHLAVGVILIQRVGARLTAGRSEVHAPVHPEQLVGDVHAVVVDPGAGGAPGPAPVEAVLVADRPDVRVALADQLVRQIYVLVAPPPVQPESS